MSPHAKVDQPTASPQKGSQPKGWRDFTGSRFGTVLVLAVTALLVMGFSYLLKRPTAAEEGITAIKLSQEGRGPAPKVGTPAQDFTATTADGKAVSLSSLKGKAVWLTFGATWCSPCQAEAPDIQSAYEKHKASGVEVLSVFISEDGATVRDYSGRIGLTFPQIPDSQDLIASAYRVNGIPVHYFIDRTGILRSIVTGSLDPERMDAQLAGISG
jgi:cytochrome c biogenesis protein CcmG, thiol:disulfide interchange protein DsbE